MRNIFFFKTICVHYFAAAFCVFLIHKIQRIFGIVVFVCFKHIPFTYTFGSSYEKTKEDQTND